MHRFAALVALAALGLGAAAPAIAQNTSEADVAAVIADYERWSHEVDPISAGQEGDAEALRRWPDVTPAAQARERTALLGFERRLERIDASGLSGDAALNRSFLLRLVADQLGSIQFDEARIPIDNDDGFFALADYLARTTPIQTTADAEAWIARLEGLPAFYRDNIANMRRGIRTRMTKPRLVAERALEIARTQANTPAEQSTLLLAFANLPDAIPAQAQDEYRARALTIIRERILPEQRAFVDFMEREYVPAARTSLGVRSTPNGAAYYRFLVNRHTTTDMTPEQIHALGEQEVARIRGEMERVIRDAGFQGTFAEFQTFLRTDPQFYAQSPEDLLEKASEIAKRADDQLPRLFGTLPRLTYGVRPVPAEMAEGYTTGRYWPGSPALGQAGGYLVNTTHLDQRPLYELPALTIHEAVPGHHLQIALAQELTGLPEFRRNTFVTAFVEGWGLYSETLGEEMGIYRTPYEQFGRYSYEMWRACRLVADTGIHWMGWSLAQARRCFDENTALSPHNITTELERYVSDPGQALGYKIGELTILRLRHEAEETLGERFNIRAFHDVMLGAGAVPMNVLEERVRAWVASQQRAQ